MGTAPRRGDGRRVGFRGPISDHPQSVPSVVARLPVAVALVELDGRVTYVNEAACLMLGGAEGDLGGRLLWDLLGDADAVSHAFFTLLLGHALEVRVDALVEGRAVPAEIAMSVVSGDEDEKYVAAVLHDVSRHRRREADLLHRSAHDNLTELPNRGWFVEHLRRALDEAEHASTCLAVLFVDLDGFKAVNDTLGHQCGDEVLFAAAGRISRALRPEDTLARYGGDEYVVLCQNLPGAEEAEGIAQRIVAAFAQPFVTSGGMARLGASVGVRVVTGGPACPHAVILDADRAMYESKRLGKGTYRLSAEGHPPDRPSHPSDSAVGLSGAPAQQPTLHVVPPVG